MRHLGLLGAIASCLCPQLVMASPQPETEHCTQAAVYELDPVADTTATLGLAVLLGSLGVVRHQEPFDPVCSATGAGRCNPNDLTAIDRYAVGRSSDSWTHVSDLGELGGMTLPLVLDGLDLWLGDSKSEWGDWGTDIVVMLQAQLAAGVANNLLKIAVHRPRPRQYDPASYKAVRESQHSFPCGHCLSATAGPTALAVTYWWRHPNNPSRFWVLGGATLWALVGSWARVEAGAHFPTDVLAGMAIGSMAGVLIPWAHRLKTPLAIGFAPAREDGPAFVTLSGGF